MKDTTPSPDRIIVWLAGQMKGKRGPAWDRLWDFLSADPYFTHRIPKNQFEEESPMTQPIDGTLGPDDPTREQLPPLTAPLVKEYVTRIRLMEKAFDLAFNAIINSRYSHRQSPDLGAVLALHSLKKSYHAILQSLLEESGLLQPEDTDGKDPKGA